MFLCPLEIAVLRNKLELHVSAQLPRTAQFNATDIAPTAFLSAVMTDSPAPVCFVLHKPTRSSCLPSKNRATQIPKSASLHSTLCPAHRYRSSTQSLQVHGIMAAPNRTRQHCYRLDSPKLPGFHDVRSPEAQRRTVPLRRPAQAGSPLLSPSVCP